MGIKADDVRKVGVIGAGAMGAGIAQAVASADREAVLLDIFDSALDRAVTTIEKSLARFVKKGEMEKEKSESILSAIHATTHFDDIAEYILK